MGKLKNIRQEMRRTGKKKYIRKAKWHRLAKDDTGWRDM